MRSHGQGERADADERRAEQHRRAEGRGRTADQGGQGDAGRLDHECREQQSGARPAAAQPRPQRRGRYGGQAHEHPGAAADPAGGALADGGDQEGPGDDVADALQGVADEQRTEPAVCAGARADPAHGGDGGPFGPQIPRGGGEQRGDDGGGPPGGAPVGDGTHHQDQHAGQRDAAPHPAERPAGQLGRMSPQVVQEGSGRDDEHQGARHAGCQPQQAPAGGAVGEGHRGERAGQQEQTGAQDRARPDQHGGQDAREGTDEIARVVRGGQVRPGPGGQAGLGVHQGQDRGVDEAAHSHGRRERGRGPGRMTPGRRSAHFVPGSLG